MYHRGRKKIGPMIILAVLLLSYPTYTLHKSITTRMPETDKLIDNTIENTIIDFEEDYTVKFNKKFGVPWNSEDYFTKESHRYTIVKDNDIKLDIKDHNESKIVNEETSTIDYSVIPLELTSTTENVFSVTQIAIENDLAVIPLSKTEKNLNVEIKQILRLTSSTELGVAGSDTTESSSTEFVTEKNETISLKNGNIKVFNTSKNNFLSKTIVTPTIKENFKVTQTLKLTSPVERDATESDTSESSTTESVIENIETTSLKNLNNKVFNSTKTSYVTENTVTTIKKENITYVTERYSDEKLELTTLTDTTTEFSIDNDTETTSMTPTNTAEFIYTNGTTLERLNTTTVNSRKNISRSDVSTEDTDVPIFTELDTEDAPDVPEDYYDTKDVVPTTAPKTDALSVIFGLAGSVVESVAERVVPKGIFDLFKRMQRQNEALEAERLRSREENGGLGQFTRGILKSISSGIGKPLSQLMAGVRDIGSLDSDRGFINSLASGVTSVADAANSLVDSFKDRVQAIYPGTVWCGDGRSATARSSDLGLFFFTDTCCRQHDACKLYIRAGETKYGLTNTGLFTRSHCSCDTKFRDCLRRTNSLVSAQIGLTYFNVLGPQCFRRAHPIVKCVKKTRITGQKCEEYELDYSKPRMWQWFDNETF